MKRHIFEILSVFCLLALVRPLAAQSPMSVTPSRHYATDMFPGFDLESEIVSPSKKTPRWFGWITGPKMSTATDQMAWIQSCVSNSSWRTARKACDALVRAWPTSPEAPLAQKLMADILLNHELDSIAAFAEYRYLADFYSTQCDYDATLRQMYEVARLMRAEGKTFCFFHFDNTVDVRRAFEAIVLRAPGADFAPAALLAVAELRDDAGDYDQAISDYENLRNLYAQSDEARAALHAEGAVRMKALDEHTYNRPRCQDTIDFLRLALQSSPDVREKPDFEAWLAKAISLLESEAYQAARFYDSPTRTRRSAISAYEKFLREYPASSYTETVRQRLDELRQDQGEVSK